MHTYMYIQNESIVGIHQVYAIVYTVHTQPGGHAYTHSHITLILVYVHCIICEHAQAVRMYTHTHTHTHTYTHMEPHKYALQVGGCQPTKADTLSLSFSLSGIQTCRQACTICTLPTLSLPLTLVGAVSSTLMESSSSGSSSVDCIFNRA